MSRAQVIAAFKSGEFSLHELAIWTARFLDEPPKVNGEFAWIALTLADLD